MGMDDQPIAVMPPSPSSPVVGWDLDGASFISLLGRLIGEARHLQNNPPENIPKEDRVVRHVLDVLSPLSEENGGPLSVCHVTYVEGRGNLIIEYPGTDPERIVSFVGCHMDVVTANPDQWDFDPFSLSQEVVEGGEGEESDVKLRGRGTTDCLGHVALFTELFRFLGEHKPALKTTVMGVFIANEENFSILGVGVDQLAKEGQLEKVKRGPVYWVDAADKQPLIGTGGMIAWKLRGIGKLFHSGLPHKAINPMEMTMEALNVIQSRFYKDFGPHPKEKDYGFATPSTMKPTQWSFPGSSVNQIPSDCSISGDCRITPFYDIKKVMAKIREYVDDINADIEGLPSRGPASKYTLPAEELRGKLEVSFEESAVSGIACNLSSEGYKALCTASKEVLGSLQPFSITGSLPLVRDLQESGFDIQIMGYGVLSTYHARNEYCLLNGMKQGFKIAVRIIDIFESKP
ncbi:hypothetical protein CBR_g51240 [Chara braunii]|uniref:Peptidase M20 dimerisation domain-containing protein n=1 Tax=Chara braunii TaxID=69332 RepID=A0A388M8B5_CHABU|nr:hypothetical protein CBR_g51240 [Chara braunii]|eukprot:GBG90733.1 hypothetical protein CBR_g51240 [Chara braunii]